MEKIQAVHMDCGCARKSERYITFEGIDCGGNASRVIGFIERNIGDSEPYKRFWNYFMAKRKPRSGPAPDDLFLVHCHINQIRELFEERTDVEALELLSMLEEECC